MIIFSLINLLSERSEERTCFREAHLECRDSSLLPLTLDVLQEINPHRRMIRAYTCEEIKA